MIEIAMKGDLGNPVFLENLKQRLDSLGVNSFTACFETKKVTLVRYKCLHSEEVECVLRKHGFECSCKELNPIKYQ
jgi:hypothetical protein